MSTNDPPQGPYGPGSRPPQNPANDPTAPYPQGGGGWPRQQPPQQPPPPQHPGGGWSEQPTTQWQPQQPGGWPGPGPGQNPYGPSQGVPPGGPGFYPPPPGGTSGGSKATWWIVGGAAAVVLVLLIAVGVVVAIRSSGDPNPSPSTLGGGSSKAKTKVLWTLPEPPGSDIKGANTLSGLWLSDETVVRATVLGLTAYDMKNGKQQWSRPMPSGTSVCQMSAKVVDGVGAVIYGETLSNGARCDQLMAIDGNSGAQKWTTSLKQSGDRVRDYGDSFTAVSIIDGAVVAQNTDAVRAYSISTGARKWGLIPKDGTTSSCRPANALGEGDRVIIVLDCLGNRGSITAVTAAKGEAVWTHPTTSTEGDPLFMDPVSVKPLVIASRSLGGRSQLLVLDEATGALKKQISTSIGGSSALDFGDDGSRIDGQVFYHYAVKDGQLFAATEGASGARRNEIVAVDLTTGETSWTTPSASDTREKFIKVDDEGVLTLNQGGFEKLPRLVRYDANTGKASNGATLPDSVRNKLYSVTVFVQGNKILLVSMRSRPDSPPITVLGE